MNEELTQTIREQAQAGGEKAEAAQERSFAGEQDAAPARAKRDVHVLFVYPDFTPDETTHQALGNYQEGLASMSAVLKQHGYRTSLYHQTYMPSEEEFRHKLASFGHVDIIGFSMRTTAVSMVTTQAVWAQKYSDAFVLAGSYHVILVPEESLKLDGLDAVVVGEGEAPMVDLCDQIAEHGSITDTNVGSVWFKKEDGTLIKNPIRPLIENLDDLPFPDWELFDFENLGASKMNTALVMVSRGCIFRCTYCGNSQFRNIYPNKGKYCRFRSPEKAIELIETLLKKYPFIETLNFRDAIFNMYPKWFMEFIDMYIERIHKPFTCNLRFDVLNEEMVKKLAEAGVYMIDIGLESGDEHMRKTYLQRNMTDEMMINAAKWFRKYDVPVMTYNIIGLPYETLELALKTVKLNAKIDSTKAIPNIFYPYPMTVLEQTARDGGFMPHEPDPSKRVQLVQPNFPETDVLFIHHSFQRLMKKYRRIYAMPPEKAKKAEARLDRILLSPHYPRKLIVWLGELWNTTYRATRRTVLATMPGLYRRLRIMKNKFIAHR